LLARISTELRKRARLLGAAAILALVVRLFSSSPAPRSEEGVARLLGDAVGGQVTPGEFVWEPSSGPLTDLLAGRRVLFLAAAADGRRDLYRAAVRVSREGRPLGVSWTRNLTRTPLADESLLTARGRQAAFVTSAGGSVQGVSVIDLGGASVARLPWWPRLRARTLGWLESGSVAGVSRLDAVLATPVRAARLELGDATLVLALGDPPQPAALDLDGRWRAVDPALRAEAWSAPAPVPRTGELALLLLEAALGPVATELAANLRSSWLGVGGTMAGGSGAPPAAAAAELGWPPRPLPPRIQPALPGEGEWRARGGADEAPLYFTLLRPLAGEPATRVWLVAFDTRQLALRLQAGLYAPRPEAGIGGSGRIPDAARGRAVAAFDGGPIAAAGLAVDGRVVVAPRSGLATVAIDGAGRAQIGPWTGGADLGGVASLRQGLAPLLDRGTVVEGPRAPGLDDGDLAERTALGRTGDGQLVYAWSEAATAPALAAALAAAGCSEAVHLDASRGHAGLALYDGEPSVLTPAMAIAPRRYLDGSPRDFFWLERREATPPANGELAWEAPATAQPPPTWLPAVHRAAADKLGTRVELYAFAPGRFRWEMRAGTAEAAARTAEAALAPAEQARALVALGLGVAARKGARRGLALDGVLELPFGSEQAVLTVGPDGSIDIARAVADMAPSGDASELLLLADAQSSRHEARALGSRRGRAAACQLADGTLLVGRAVADNYEPLAQLLTELGCSRVVALDRGRQADGFVHLAGETPPQVSYADTVLYGFAVTAKGNARRLE
jgi:hypothetical protein